MIDCIKGRTHLTNDNDTKQQTERTFASANLLRICYVENGVMDFGVNGATDGMNNIES